MKNYTPTLNKILEDGFIFVELGDNDGGEIYGNEQSIIYYDRNTDSIITEHNFNQMREEDVSK